MSSYAAKGSFYVADGQIIGPDGVPFVARGINIRNDQLNQAVNSGQLLSDFPGLNMIRLYFEGSFSDNLSSIQASINALTSRRIVVEIEDHTGISQPPYTASKLAAEQAWYSSIAAANKTNPYVWFGTFNEPGNGTNLPGIGVQEQATYNTIRSTGNNNPIMMEEPSGGNPGLVGVNARGYDGSGPMTLGANYGAMTNIIWDLHNYGWTTHGDNSQAAADAALQGSASGASGIAGAETIASADGKVPILIGEFGNSTTGGAIDANGDQVIQAVTTSGKGFLAWGWNPDEEGDQLTTDSGQMTHYGQQIAAAIRSAAATAPPTPTPSAPASANDTTVAFGSSAAITDAGGNQWTVTAAGAVNENGAAAGYSANVEQIAYVDGAVWQENAAGLWWEWNGQNWGTGNGTATNPLPAAPPPASPNDTVVQAGSGGTITDAFGQSWTITAGGTVDVDGAAAGYSAGVNEIAYVDGFVWQENSSGLWWQWAGDTWGTGPGTDVSPLPASEPGGSATIRVVNGSSATIDASVVRSTNVGDASVYVGAPGVAAIGLGSSPTSLAFMSMVAYAVQGGSGNSVITASGGAGILAVGSGDMDVTGGSGPDVYEIFKGSGNLVIEDFSASKGDALSIPSALQNIMQQGNDGSGGIVLSFGTQAGSIDLKHVSVMPHVAYS